MGDIGSIFSSTRNLSTGSTGQDVSNVQLSLNNRPPSNLPQLNPDGIFGQKTDARVREFQRNIGLVVDGIVGPQTIKALAGDEYDPAGYGCKCCNPENFSMGQSREASDFFRNQRINSGNQFGFSSGRSSGTSSAASLGILRMLSIGQQADASAVYGASLDFSTIYISNKKGLGNRPFTIAFNNGTEIVQIMNCGTFSPRRDTLIHELAHVWQSQHHSNKFRYMVNAVDSQAGAIVASTAAAVSDPFVALNKNFPTFYPFDAYAYHPGLPFSSMAAEQMAKAIENGEGAIVAHVKGVTKNMVDPSLVTALSRTGFADHRLPGVK